MKFVIIAVVIISILAGVLFWWRFGPGFGTQVQTPKEVVLNIYGLWEEENLIKPAILEYQQAASSAGKKITINYKFQTSQNYRTRVQTQISENSGPDIFMIHNSWLPVFLKSSMLASAPQTIFPIDEFNQTLYPVVSENFTKDGKLYGVARGIDGLVLYYNEEILKNANITAPVSWDEFLNSAIKATVVDETGKIKTAGAAIGTTGNVDHWQDILGLLFFQQPDASLETPNTQSGADVLKFYTDFLVDPKKRVWDPTWESSTQAFGSGKVAFYFGPSWRAHELRQLNPSLKFGMVPPPQVRGKRVGYASYWGFVVSSKSQFQNEAWEFLKFLTSASAEKLLYQEASKVRLFGDPYSRLDLASELLNDPMAGSVVSQGPYFKSWYLVSDTRDQGLNDAISKYYLDAINDVVNKGGDPKNALEVTAKGVKQVLDDFVNPVQAPAAQ